MRIDLAIELNSSGQTLGITFMKEDGTFITHSAALDLSSCGETLEEAKINFEDAVDIFFDECTKDGTLSHVLESLGWTQKEKNRPMDPQWSPPASYGHGRND